MPNNNREIITNETGLLHQSKRFIERYLANKKKCNLDEFIKAKETEICRKNLCTSVVISDIFISKFKENLNIQKQNEIGLFPTHYLFQTWNQTRQNFMRTNLRQNSNQLFYSNKIIEWDKLFIRSGFNIKNSNNSYFIDEKHDVIKYFKKILHELDLDDCFDDKNQIFVPKETSFSQDLWLNSIERNHGGAEGGSPLALDIMDPALGGVVRELYYLGFHTGPSCDGHGRRKNWFTLNPDEHDKFNELLAEISEGNWYYDAENITLVNKSLKSYEDSRLWLLDLAEKLHDYRIKDFSPS